jgi:hypothetical protein
MAKQRTAPPSARHEHAVAHVWVRIARHAVLGCKTEVLAEGVGCDLSLIS